LKDLQNLMIRSGITPETVALIITEGRREFGGERMHWPPPESRKDPQRAEAIRQAAARLPTGVVTQRLGVSRQVVSYHLKKCKNVDR